MRMGTKSGMLLWTCHGFLIRCPVAAHVLHSKGNASSFHCQRARYNVKPGSQLPLVSLFPSAHLYQNDVHLIFFPLGNGHGRGLVVQHASVAAESFFFSAS